MNAVGFFPGKDGRISFLLLPILEMEVGFLGPSWMLITNVIQLYLLAQYELKLCAISGVLRQPRGQTSILYKIPELPKESLKESNPPTDENEPTVDTDDE